MFTQLSFRKWVEDNTYQISEVYDVNSFKNLKLMKLPPEMADSALAFFAIQPLVYQPIQMRNSGLQYKKISKRRLRQIKIDKFHHLITSSDCLTQKGTETDISFELSGRITCNPDCHANVY